MARMIKCFRSWDLTYDSSSPNRAGTSALVYTTFQLSLGGPVGTNQIREVEECLRGKKSGMCQDKEARKASQVWKTVNYWL